MIRTSIDRPVTVWMVVIFFISLGLISYYQLKTGLFPNISKPIITIETKYKGASAKEIEQEITKKIEDSLSSLSSLKTISSITKDEYSQLFLEFKWDVKLDSKLLDIRQKLDDIKSKLPIDADNSIIKKFNPTDSPIFTFAIKTDISNANIMNQLQRELFQKLERIEGVSKVNISGVPKTVIKIVVDKDKIDKYLIDVDTIKLKLSSSNISKLIGEIYKNDYEYKVVIRGKFENLESIKNLPIKKSDNSFIFLSDIAKIENFQEKPKIVSKLNGGVSINVSVFKNSDGNSVTISKRIEDYLNSSAIKELKDIEILTLYNQASFINESIDMVKSNGWTGMALTMVVLILFLRSFKSTIIIAITMPVALISAMIFFNLFNISLNIFSLIGLTLAIGMMVDSSIVILENSHRLINLGLTPKKAVITAVTEIKGSIIASNLTTFAVFIPIIFLPEVLGDVFSNLSYAIIFTLLASMILSFSLMPMLITQFLRKDNFKESWYGSFHKKIGTFVRDKYIILIKYLLQSPFIIRHGILTLLSLILIAIILIAPNFSIFPSIKQNTISIKANFKGNYSNQDVQKRVMEINQKLMDENYIKNISFSIEDREFESFIELKDISYNSIVKQKVKDVFFKYPDLKYHFVDISPMATLSIAGGEPVEVTIMSNRVEKREEIYNKIKTKVENEAKVSKLNVAYIENIYLKIKREELAKKSISIEEFVDICKIKLQGKKVKSAFILDNQYDIMLSSNQFISLDEFLYMPIILNGEKYLISQFVEIKKENLLTKIYKSEKIKANSFYIYNSNSYEDIIKKIKQVNVEESIIKIEGSYQGQRDLIFKLTLAFLAAIILIYMTLASQFESLFQPIIIISTIPLSLIGAIGGLLLTNNTLSIPAAIGVIMLVGIVVNNAIILIEFINVLRSRGVPKLEAIIEATSLRLRPIMMTTMTTLLGMIPTALGLGSGAELYQSLAIVVIFGLLVSTILTLIVVPISYLILENSFEIFRKKTSLIKNKLQGYNNGKNNI